MKYVGLWNDGRYYETIDVVEIGGRLFALDGWNGERFLHCWECVHTNAAMLDGIEYEIRPVYRFDVEDIDLDNIEDDTEEWERAVEIVDYEVESWEKVKKKTYFFPSTLRMFDMFPGTPHCVDMEEILRLAQEYWDPEKGESFEYFRADFLCGWDWASDEEIERYGYYDSETGVLVEGTGEDEDEEEEEEE